jgi:FAD/FMN-containing dehydrogenase
MIGVTQRSAAELGPGGHWRNWVGNQSFIARRRAEPGSEDELAALVREASRQNLSIRVAGSGHSFTPIVATSGLLLTLTNMQGLVSADLDRKRVVVRAGTRIGDIGRALKGIGLSLANQGDIDTQAIAGALSTGTHGTGIDLGCLSSQAVGMRLVQPDGSVFDVDADRDPETMAAAQVSIGIDFEPGVNALAARRTFRHEMKIVRFFAGKHWFASHTGGDMVVGRGGTGAKKQIG